MQLIAKRVQHAVNQSSQAKQNIEYKGASLKEDGSRPPSLRMTRRAIVLQVQSYTVLEVRPPGAILILSLPFPADMTPGDKAPVMPMPTVGMPPEGAPRFHGCALASAKVASHFPFWCGCVPYLILLGALLLRRGFVRGLAATSSVTPVVLAFKVVDDLYCRALALAIPPVAAYAIHRGRMSGNLAMFHL